MDIPTISEELKELLLRSRGKEAAIVILAGPEGKWGFLPDGYKVEKRSDDTLVLKKLMPVPPSDSKRAFAKEIAKRLAPTLDVEGAIEAALLEKTDEQIASIGASSSKAGAKLERRRGCFWLKTPDEEIVL